MASCLGKKGEQAKALIHSQLDALDYVMDFATKRQPITEAWIRSLHAAMCKSQETYKVMTEIGPQTQPLPKGEYKHLPNHVMLKDGTMHAYAPADLTPAEMHRFVEAIEGESFRTAHPALQASYAHYAFVCIHPFADGNGRVARALACVFTYRSASIPVMILAENRKQYLDSLHASDDGDHQSFVDFVTQRCFDAILMVNESIRTALVPHPSEFLEPIKNLYVTRGGFTHEQVDEMGKMLFKVFDDELKKGVEKYQIPNRFHITVQMMSQSSPQDQKYRVPMNIPNTLHLKFSTGGPAKATIARSFILLLPKDCGRDDDFVIRAGSPERALYDFRARVVELTPTTSAALQMRMVIFVEGIFGRAMQELSKSAALALGRSRQ